MNNSQNSSFEDNDFVSFIKWTDLLCICADLVLFRGQPIKGRLLPGVAREDPKKDTTDEEKRILNQLKLQGASMLPSSEATNLDILVLAQHYGLKTRLLDWTSNPLAALWFACSDPNKNVDVYAYALEAETLLEENVYDSEPFLVRILKFFSLDSTIRESLLNKGGLHFIDIQKLKSLLRLRTTEISRSIFPSFAYPLLNATKCLPH